MTKTERALSNRAAAHIRWSKCTDRKAATRAATEASWRRFEKQVDPNFELNEDERLKRAESARKAYYVKMAIKSAKARRGAR